MGVYSGMAGAFSGAGQTGEPDAVRGWKEHRFYSRRHQRRQCFAVVFKRPEPPDGAKIMIESWWLFFHRVPPLNEILPFYTAQSSKRHKTAGIYSGCRVGYIYASCPTFRIMACLDMNQITILRKEGQNIAGNILACMTAVSDILVRKLFQAFHIIRLIVKRIH